MVNNIDLEMINKTWMKSEQNFTFPQVSPYKQPPGFFCHIGTERQWDTSPLFIFVYTDQSNHERENESDFVWRMAIYFNAKLG